MNNKEKSILNFLRDNGKSSTSRIAAAIRSNQWMTEKYLEKLLNEGKVIVERETRATYWYLPEEVFVNE